MVEPVWPPLPPPHTRVGVGGVLVRSGRALVNRAVYRERFTIPSGYVESGETLEEALVRELDEETGVKARVGPLLLTRHRVVDPRESDVYFAFLLDHVAGEPTPRPPEIAEVRGVSLDELDSAGWISELSRLAIRVAMEARPGWASAQLTGREPVGLATNVYLPPALEAPRGRSGNGERRAT